jgi:hypothetical protein
VWKSRTLEALELRTRRMGHWPFSFSSHIMPET